MFPALQQVGTNSEHFQGHIDSHAGPSLILQWAGTSPEPPWAAQTAMHGTGPALQQTSSHCTRHGLAANRAGGLPSLQMQPQ